MDSSDVLTALEELEKWRARRVKIEKRLVALRRERWAMADYRQLLRRRKDLPQGTKDLDDEEALLLEEMVQVDGQVAYYVSLTRDMKKALDPPGLGKLLRSLRKA